MARLCVTLSALLDSGIQVADALTTSEGVVGNLKMSKAIQAVRSQVLEGRGVARSMRDTQLFPPVMVQMITTAEDTGDLSKVLAELADSYDAEVDTAIQRMSAVLEPLVTIFMGGIVLLIVLSVLLPIMKISHMARL